MFSSPSVRRLPLVLAALVAAPLLLGACGSSSTPTATGDQPPASSAPATTTTKATDKITTTEAESNDDTSTTDVESGDDSTTSVVVDDEYTEFCAKAVELQKDFEDSDPSDASFMTDLKSVYQQLADAAPDDIHDDLAKLNEYVQNVNSVDEMTSAPADIQALAKTFDDAGKEKCGIT